MTKLDNIKDALIFVLDSADSSVKDYLIECLDGDTTDIESVALDSSSENKEKDGTGKLTKTPLSECRSEDPFHCRFHGMAARALAEKQIEKEDNVARINPVPQKTKRQYFAILSKLKRAQLAIIPPDNPADTDVIKEDIVNLSKEGKIKNYRNLPKYEEYNKALTEYKAIVKASKVEAKIARRLLDKEDFEAAENAIANLNARGKQMNKQYQKVLNRLQGVYDDIVERIEMRESGAGQGVGSVNEKEQYAPLWGENSAEYRKRQKKLGRAKEIPETVKNIDEIVSQAEQRWQRVAALSPEEFAKVKLNWRKTVYGLMQRSALASNVYSEGLNGVLEDHLKSQHELTRKGKQYQNRHVESGVWGIIGGNENTARYVFSRNVFGTPRGMAEEKYEKYGCLHSKVPVSGDNLTGGQYGKNIIRWKPESVVATMFCGDSLCLSQSGNNFCTCSLVSNPSPVSFNPHNRDIINTLKKGPLKAGLQTMCKMFGAPYMEIQLHGTKCPRAEDIESISFNSETDVAMLSPKAIAKIKELQIDTYIGGKQIEVNSDSTVKSK